jgi:hypothetical protein
MVPKAQSHRWLTRSADVTVPGPFVKAQQYGAAGRRASAVWPAVSGCPSKATVIHGSVETAAPESFRREIP